MTDPRNDAVKRPRSNGTWGWIAGIAILVLIAIIMIAGWNTKTDTASNAPVPSASAPISAPSRTPLETTPPASTTGAAPMAPSPAPVPPGNR